MLYLTSGITLEPAGLEIWKPIRGQCVKYRQIQQSCASEPLGFTDPALNPTYHRKSNGQTYDRPLVRPFVGAELLVELLLLL